MNLSQSPLRVALIAQMTGLPSTCSHSWTCGVEAGDLNLSLLVCFPPLSVSSCLSSFVLICPSASLISPTLISPHLILAFTPPLLRLLCFLILFMLSPQFSHSLFLFPPFSLHTFCLPMAFDKGVLDQLLAAPAARPQHLFSSSTHISQLLKIWAGRDFLWLSHSMFVCVCVCASVSSCLCIHLLEPGMPAH